ncbi:hypothetical protein CC1G_09309 [Coprinopsis cinerea okayama7|uniref:Xylanolytic transcriptional activator regulatory domain-containing protein n=1 Tax=Coprinopsis cinerea (strain Okayama-7 / 130 / ATCC MYA-4618 / FGSC 9003) TaxID=240176 RepID=A8N5K4_COPC7|nr:hypothetical protein CC1G_09309 [Coprinopsis cinerea okayama7\|eukprot:XP_001830149.1 hypothetical protein CC1G_09309 [Coprinopsis cinerea okayama7\
MQAPFHRKRKMIKKCDGVKPACQQCTRAKKAECCEYDDGKGKTRTQLLKETIARLEQRVKELEDPSYLAASVMLFDVPSENGHQRNPSFSGSGSPPSSYDSPDSAFLSAFPHTESSASPSTPWSQLQSIASPMNPPMMPDIFFDERHSPFAPSDDISMILLDIFAPHSRQSGLEIDIDTLRSNLRHPGAEQKHPALMNAIYLWACFISRPEPLCQHEDYYLRQSLEAIPGALRSGQSLDVIRTSCVLATYFLANGRVLEGSYHASAAAALADQIGLGNSLTESDDKQELCAERVLTFWQVYNLDKTWSVVLRKRSLISDGPDTRSMITCPWPQDIADYKQHSRISASGHSPTIQAFLAGSMSAAGFSSAALRTKASALLSEADRIAAQWCPGMKISAQLIDGINNLERIINLFLSTLVQPDQLDTVTPEEKFNSIVAHTIAHCAMIHLHRPFVSENPVSVEKCAQAARACIALIRYLNEREFVFLDPIMGPCWSWVADDTVSRLDVLERAWPMSDTSDVINELGILLYAMTKLGNHFPVVAPALSRVQKRLA